LADNLQLDIACYLVTKATLSKSWLIVPLMPELKGTYDVMMVSPRVGHIKHRIY